MIARRHPDEAGHMFRCEIDGVSVSKRFVLSSLIKFSEYLGLIK